MYVVPPLIIVFGWVVDGMVYRPWANKPPGQVSDAVVLCLSAYDLGTKLLIYSVAAFVGTRFCEPSRWALWRASLIAASLLAGLEFTYRWWGASASMGGDLVYRVSRGFGLTPLGYAAIPALGILLGIIATVLFRLRHNAP
jgi:hypothetical protein